MYITFNNNGLLSGESFIWLYDDFEEHLSECITPSMYRYMAEFVRNNISDEEIQALQRDEYRPGDLEEQAVNAYFNLPINRKITLHEMMLNELHHEKKIAEAKEEAAINAMLDENSPFGTDNPISHEYTEFLRKLINESRKKVDRFEHEIHEEEQWRGGHEEGSENFIW